jgi:chromosome segregation ATPase
VEEVADGVVGADDAGEVSIDEAMAALGYSDTDAEATIDSEGEEAGAQNGDDLEPDEEDEQANEDEDDEDSESEAAQRENTRQKYKRQRDEAFGQLESFKQRDQEWNGYYRKLDEAYSRVQSDFEAIQADLEEDRTYIEQLEARLRDETGWEPSEEEVKLRELSRENRRLKREREVSQQQQQAQVQQVSSAQVEVEAKQIAQTATSLAKKYGINVRDLASAAQTILMANQTPDLEVIAKNLALSTPKAAAALSQRDKNRTAPRTLRPGRRASAAPPTSDDDMEAEAVRMMRDRLDREGRVFNR